MIEQYARYYYQRYLVDPLVQIVNNFFSPIQVTFAAGVLGILAACTIVMNWPILSILLLLLSGYADTFDGSLARHQAQTSPFGAVLDILTDRLVEFSIIFALYLQQPAIRGLMCFLMLGCVLLCVTSFLVVGIFTVNQSEKEFYYSPGLIERAEAFILFIFMIMFPRYFTTISILFVCLVTLTILIRVYEFYKNCIPTRASK